jgi:prepilin-type N-terminal cleavage/methylation domain-containing protein/prepilin-type processing-associated H-X9-DG protein
MSLKDELSPNSCRFLASHGFAAVANIAQWRRAINSASSQINASAVKSVTLREVSEHRQQSLNSSKGFGANSSFDLGQLIEFVRYLQSYCISRPNVYDWTATANGIRIMHATFQKRSRLGFSRPGFTLVELLVVIAIIGTLVALLLPAVQMARESARASQCKNQLKQVGLAAHQYHDSMGRLPAGWIAKEPEGTPGWGWASALLPYLEQAGLESSIQRQLPIAHANNLRARESVIPVLICPSDANPKVFTIFSGGSEGDEDEAFATNIDSGTAMFRIARANYVGVFGTLEIEDAPAAGDGAFYFLSRTRFAEITDGLSNTALVGERGTRQGNSVWAGVVEGANEAMVRVVGVADHAPNDPHHHFDDFASYHPGGVHFLFGDGSVQRLNNQIDVAIYQALCTRGGGETAISP